MEHIFAYFIKKLRIDTCLFLLFCVSYSTNSYSLMNKIPYTEIRNKDIPESIYEETLEALSFYPELKDTPIEFRFKPQMNGNVMRAQPRFGSLLAPRSKRSYIIFISESFTIDHYVFEFEKIPSDVVIGWIGHELGHVMDYETRSNWNILGFGFRYMTSKKYVIEAERTADTFAVTHGMAPYIVKTKNFILNHTGLTENYKNKIKRLYLSPEQIMEIVAELEDELEDKEISG